MTDKSQPIESSVGGLREPNLRRGECVRFTFDGQPIQAYGGETIAAALFVAGYRTLRESPNGHVPRGPFCWMGLCQECTVEVDGVRRPACRVQCADGLVVRKGTIA